MHIQSNGSIRHFSPLCPELKLISSKILLKKYHDVSQYAPKPSEPGNPLGSQIKKKV